MAKIKNQATHAQHQGSKQELFANLDTLAAELAQVQERLFAQKKYAILVVLQGLDAAGKDNVVKRVFAQVNPAGCRVHSFKIPTEPERLQDFLWRAHAVCPAKGMLHVFNRSHYEDVLVPVVSGSLSGKALQGRYAHINNFEQLLLDSGTIVLKYFLHVSAEHQHKRLLARTTNPEKFWKNDPNDLNIFAQRDAYLAQYDQVFINCSAAAPWAIIPADDKPMKNYLILEHMLKTLRGYAIDFPPLALA